jgi:hypothetical protein
MRNIVERLKVLASEMAADLKWPIIIGLFGVDALYGVLATFYVGFLFGIIGAVLFFLVIQSWLIYYVAKKIREENSEAKVMSEGWEGRSDTGKVVEEYLDLIEEDKKKAGS